MKIGILTYHRSHNYGALLQAIALRHVLTGLGHDAYFIDYWPEYHADMYKLFSSIEFHSYSLLGKIKYIVKTAILSRNKIKRIKSFNRFIDRFITPHSLPTTESFDIIIYGSDQIWRKQPRIGYHFNPVYFGDNQFEAKKHITYAASMGNIKDLSPADEETIQKWLRHFSFISVRETDLQKKLSEIGVQNVVTVLDPTLLLNANDWKKLLDIRPRHPRPYVLFYDLMPDSFDEQRIRDFAQSKNLDLVILKARIDRFHHGKNEYIAEDPEGMMSLIANAEYVFTSSYHGLVFSIIFEKQFTAAFKTNSERANTLLTTLGIQEQLMRDIQSPFPRETIDYSFISPLADYQKTASNSILKQNCELGLNQQFTK